MLLYLRHMRRRGLWGQQPPLESFKWPFSGKKASDKVIFGQNHLIFGQALEKILRQESSASPNETGPVRLFYIRTLPCVSSVNLSSLSCDHHVYPSLISIVDER